MTGNAVVCSERNRGAQIPREFPIGPVTRSQALLKILAAYWLAFLFVNYLQDWNFNFPTLARRALVASVGVALCLAMARALRRWEPPTAFGRVAVVLFLSLTSDVAFACFNLVTMHFFVPVYGGECAFGYPCFGRFLLISAANYSASFLFLFIAWGATFLGFVEAARSVTAERRAGAARDEARLAELRALRYQVDPHFLFNCLNSLGTLVDRGDPEAARAMIGDMSSFLRYGLAIDPLADVALDDEIEMQRRYLEIERRRFAHRLTVEITVEPAVSRAKIPSLLLQPLVENAVKHGVASTSAEVTVSVTAVRRPDGGMRIIVEDDAPSSRMHAEPIIGIGINNVRERLRARFGSDGTLSYGKLARGGFHAEIAMPLSYR